MIEAFKQFDTYSLKARIFPSLIAGLPTLALLFVIVPWDHIGLSHVTAGTMSIVLLFAFADVARRTGKHIQTKLGTGTTPELWYRNDSEIPSGAKDRYRTFVAKAIKMRAPTESEETTDPVKANDFYNTAGNWLREHTRDQRKFSILFSENVTYGFRRNIMGLKPISLLFNIVVLSICVILWYFTPPYFSKIAHFTDKLVIVFIAGVLHSAYMTFAVAASSVREASRTYGRQLILSCETLMKASSSSPGTRTKSDSGS